VSKKGEITNLFNHHVSSAYTFALGDTEYVFYSNSTRLERAHYIDDITSLLEREETRANISEFNSNSVLQGADHLRWAEAMRKELDSLQDKDTISIEAPQRQDVLLSCRWVLKDKRPNPDGSLGEPKARIAIHGYGAREGIDYQDTFAPTSQMSTLRYFLTLVASLGFRMKQLDVKTAFLNAGLKEIIFVIPPKEILDESNPLNLDKGKHKLDLLYKTRFWRMTKSIYGIKQAPHNW
jgi:hypothetical protein